MCNFFYVGIKLEYLAIFACDNKATLMSNTVRILDVFFQEHQIYLHNDTKNCGKFHSVTSILILKTFEIS